MPKASSVSPIVIVCCCSWLVWRFAPNVENTTSTLQPKRSRIWMSPILARLWGNRRSISTRTSVQAGHCPFVQVSKVVDSPYAIRTNKRNLTEERWGTYDGGTQCSL
jgi:hypothetical protein